MTVCFVFLPEEKLISLLFIPEEPLLDWMVFIFGRVTMRITSLTMTGFFTLWPLQEINGVSVIRVDLKHIFNHSPKPMKALNSFIQTLTNSTQPQLKFN